MRFFLSISVYILIVYSIISCFKTALTTKNKQRSHYCKNVVPNSNETRICRIQNCHLSLKRMIFVLSQVCYIAFGRPRCVPLWYMYSVLRPTTMSRPTNKHWIHSFLHSCVSLIPFIPFMLQVTRTLNIYLFVNEISWSSNVMLLVQVGYHLVSHCASLQLLWNI